MADVITFIKPKDNSMHSYLREFLFLVCRFNLSPVVSKISTKDNDIADFLSHNYTPNDVM